MTERIKHISDLPPWFKLDKYNNAKNLDANGWYEQICIRANCLTYFDSEEGSACKKITQDKDFKEAIKAIREKPIYNMRVDGKLPLFFYFDNIAILLKSESPHLTPSIHPMSLLEFDLLRREIDPKRLEYVAEWKNQFLDCDKTTFFPLYKYETWIKEPLCNSVRQDLAEEMHSSGKDPVIVDLNYPDKILIENFKRYILGRRAELKNEHLSKHSRQCNFSEWTRYGALPYLDLKIWEFEAKVKIPHRVLADAIYPQGDGGEETIRKTTIPLANLLLTDKLLRQLVAQASH